MSTAYILAISVGLLVWSTASMLFNFSLRRGDMWLGILSLLLMFLGIVVFVGNLSLAVTP